MLPASYATTAALVLAAGGLLACFVGYRLFRLVLGIYGFLLGAFFTTSVTGAPDAWTMGMAILVGGIVGAILMIVAYFVGVGLVGAGLAALGLNVAWQFLVESEPPTIVLVLVAVLGALGALSIARYVVIVGTAVAGAWTLLVSGLALAGDPMAERAAATGRVWILYPLEAEGGGWWIVPAWLGLATAGVLVQLATSRARQKRRKAKG